MRGSVTQAYRILLLGDEKYGFRCRRVPFILTSFCLAPLGNKNGLKCRLKVSRYTLGRRKCSEVSPKRAVLYSRATKMLGSVTQACRAALSGDENVRKCCLSVPRYTLGRRRSAEVPLKRAALHPRATKRRGIVAQACRAAPPGDGKCGFRCRRVPFILTSFCLAPFGNENGLKCRLKVSYCTLGRRKVRVSLPRSPLHSYVILPYTHGQQKWTEVSPRRAVPHSRATKRRGSVA